MFAVAQKIANLAGYDLVPTQTNVAQPAQPVTKDDKQLSLDKKLDNIERLLKNHVPLVAINEMAKHIHEDPERIEHLFKSMLDPNNPYLLLSIQGHCLNLKRMGNTPGAAALLTLMSKTEGVHSAIQQISRLNVDESEDKENAPEQKNNNKKKI